MSRDKTPTGSRALARFLDERLGENLRSVVHYEDDGREIIHARDDVFEQYSADEVDHVFQDLGIESLEKPIQEDLYVHGDLNCVIRMFDEAVEMHFILAPGEGIAVAVEPAAFITQSTFISECLKFAGLTGV